MVILLASLTALGELMSVGSRASVQAELRSQAAMLAQTKMSEIVSGSDPLQSQSEVPFANVGNDWSFSVDVVPGPVVDLLQVTVTVQHTLAIGTVDVTQKLTRYVRDPLLFLEQTDAESSTVTVE